MGMMFLIAGWLNMGCAVFVAWHGDNQMSLTLSGMALTCWVGRSVENRNGRW